MSIVTALYETNGFAAGVAAEVRSQAARRGWRQKDVRELLGLQKAGASSRWNGRIPFRLDEIGMLCDAWGIAPADLMPSKWTPQELPRLDLNQQPCGYQLFSTNTPEVVDLSAYRERRRPNTRRGGRRTTDAQPATRPNLPRPLSLSVVAL